MQIDGEIHSGGDDSCFVQVTAAANGEGCDRIKAIQRQGITIHTETVVRVAGPETEVALYTMFASYQKSPGIDPKADEPSRPEPAYLYFTVIVEIFSGLSQQNTT